MRRLLLVGAVAALAAPGAAQARPAPVAWCGTAADEQQVDRTPELEAGSGQQVRFVYVMPQDGTDNFPVYASGIATDAAWMDEWWEAQDPARTPRFDRYPFPGCATRFGALDIGFVRLINGGAAYISFGVFQSLTNELRTKFPALQKTIVYYDGPVADPNVCGQSPTNAASGGDFGIAFVYLQSACELTPPGGGKSAEVAAHELLHDFGALPRGAPNPCPDDNGHPCDSESDVLYPYVAAGSTLDNVVLDFNHDDYYAHNGTWLDVQDSPWLIHLPQFPASFSLTGSGTIAVRTPDGALLPCTTGCANVAVDNGEQLLVVGVPDPGWRVKSWSGSCSSASSTCAVTVSGPVTMAVTFERAPIRAVIRVTGKGRVTQARTATTVTLRAVAARGWRFAAWSGACHGGGACVLTKSGTVRARFVKR